MSSKKRPSQSRMWSLGNMSSPKAQWTGKSLYLVSPEGRTLVELTKAQTRNLFVHLQGLYRD